MTAPQVSVVIPAYNCAHLIPHAIDSALRQNVAVEILVVNDCSKDDLDAVMDRYSGNPSVVYMKNAVNLGAAESRNRAVAVAKSPYIAFLDADDYWTDGKLTQQLQALESSGAVLCCTARELMSPNGELTGRILPVKEKITYQELLKHNSISCSSVLIRTEVAREFPMEHADSHEDYIMWLRVLQKYDFACGINEPLLKYRLSNSGKSGNKLKSAKMTLQVYRYMGFTPWQTFRCFCSYALHGVWKYLPIHK